MSVPEEQAQSDDRLQPSSMTMREAYLSACLSVYLFTYLPIYLFYPSIYVCICVDPVLQQNGPHQL